MAANSINCVNLDEKDIDFNGNIINSGEYWVGMTDPFDQFFTQRICVETVSNIDSPGSGLFATQQYTSCYDCVSNNNGLIQLNPCYQTVFEVLFINVSALTESQYLEIYSISTGDTGQALYIEFLNNGTLQKGCFNKSKIVTVSTAEYVQITAQLQSIGQQIVNDLNYTAQTDCQSCLTVSSFIYEVSNCVTVDEIEYVYLPYDFPSGHLISYTDGINEFCGVVRGLTVENVATYTFVTDYGPCRFESCCDTCLENVNKKVLIENCVDDTDQQVVWASLLFGLESTNFELGGGCFKIMGETSDPISFVGYLDYEPHSSCESCLTCNGVIYQYASCDDPTTPAGVIQTNQILPNGFSFINPFEDKCCIILGLSTGSPIRPESLPSVQPCVCDTVLEYQVFPATECLTGIPVGVLTDMNAQDGDIVKIMYGEVEFLCVQLNSTGRLPRVTYNSERDVNGDTIIYNNCTDCISNREIGVRTVNCDTQEFSIVNVPYSSYTEFLFNRDDNFIFNCFVDAEGYCRTVVEPCPQPPTGRLSIPVTDYFSCPVCRTFNPDIPPTTVSAGTEYTVCVICEDCCQSGTTATVIKPPHPTWSRLNGDAVVLLDAVQLGGMFGLNA
jgi:hypothetical protein